MKWKFEENPIGTAQSPLDFLIISDIVSSCSSVIDGSMVVGCRIFVLFIELLV